MKKPIHVVLTGFLTGCAALFTGCASTSDLQAKAEGSQNGPVIMNPRISPETVELTRYLQPKSPNHILAEVKDFRSEVTNVHLKLSHAPIEVPLERIGGTTWRGELTSDQLKRLAVSGKTMKYRGTIVAQNELGQVAMSKDQVEIQVEAPKFDPDLSG